MYTRRSVSICMLAILAISAQIAACSSFNNNNFNAPPSTVPPSNDSDFLSRGSSTDKPTTPTDRKPCDTLPYLTFPPAPNLPTKELQSAPNLAALETIERKHISDLRAYIGELKRSQQNSQLKFYEKCDVVSK